MLEQVYAEDRNVYALVDEVLNQKSMLAFQHSIEKKFPEYFNCERATVVMVQRFKKFMYRICKNPTTGEDYIEKFDMDDGLAGFVNMSANSLFQPFVQKDHRFVAKIDDPNFVERQSRPAREIIGLPVFASDDTVDVGDPDCMSRHPRAVILLINKLPNPETKEKIYRMKSIPDEAERLEQMSSAFL